MGLVGTVVTKALGPAALTEGFKPQLHLLADVSHLSGETCSHKEYKKW